MSTTPKPRELSKAYDPREVEGRLYEWWESQGFFIAKVDRKKEPYTIIMPPPNVTGELHLGHALTATIEDALVRYHRMRGYSTLYLPGADHAGIATQTVVERQLRKEGGDRHELGREKFLERVWEWVGKYGHIIDNQHRRLGASCDWTRKAFTLDPGPSRATRTTFKRLYDKGLIYRGERMINWCVSCRTALSDLEVEHEEMDGHLWHIRYRLEGGDGHLTVATTRPETLLGDTAVAVNPNDPRYKAYVGRRVVLPVLGRPIPVIADEAVSTEFGTGALKITPGHDPNDFEVGKRHGLPIVNILNPDGTLNMEAGKYAGTERYKARRLIVEQLEAEGLLEKVVPHRHSVGHCQRSGDVVEPIVSTQWFVRIEPLAKPAIEAVTSGRITFVPERFEKVYLNWMENIRDWCISRQLWWGHRIPVWYCADCEHQTVAVDDPAGCERCGSVNIAQDQDVLDTWFSSGLWPHSTLGWPDDTPDLRYFYPTSVMETGYDIIFFWVARMIMLGIENMGEVPFRTVYLHGLVRDEHGQKMSKTRGNVVDPLRIVEEHGADALRFALSAGTTPGNDSRMQMTRVQSARNFANKMWNATRFVLTQLDGAESLAGWSTRPSRKHREDRWIASRLEQVTREVHRLWGDYQLGEAERVVHDFIWGEFCDWYIELAKVRMRAGDTSPRKVLAYVLERSLRLLHPFMPFVTEELWQHLTEAAGRPKSWPVTITLMPYPAPSEEAVDQEALTDMALVTDIVRAIRNVRAEFKVDPARQLDATLSALDAGAALRGEAEAVRQLARVGSLTFANGVPPAVDNAVTVVVGRVTVTMPMGDIVNVAAERERLRSELTETEQRTQSLAQRLGNEQFTSKAPAEVVEREGARLDDQRARIARLRELLSQLGA
ncbi:MAG: valine--tRNA ligase [SAR202 cluster bacterium]|nr:valine--tRNA ligase [SAR202 cluster bacterium]